MVPDGNLKLFRINDPQGVSSSSPGMIPVMFGRFFISAKGRKST